MGKKRDEEITVDFSGMKSFFGRWNAEHLVIAALLIVAIGIVFWIRLLPVALPAADIWAEQTARTNIHNNIAAQISQQFPNLPQESRDRLVNEQVAKVYAEQGAEISAQQTVLADQIRGYMRYEHGGTQYTYLGDLDSYYWMRYTRNWLATGQACDTIKDGQCWDTYTLAPVGTQMGFNPSLHVFAIGYLYKFITLFNNDYPLPATSFFVPVILGVLGIIPAFFIGRRLSGNTAGFFAALLIALHPLVLSRSMGSDNDIWNVVVPLYIFWMAIEAVQTEKLWWRITAAVLAGVFVGIQAAAWVGWFFIYLIVLLALIGSAGYSALEHILTKRDFRIWTNTRLIAAAAVLIIFYVSSFVFLAIGGNAGTYLTTPKLLFSAGTALDVAITNEYWPNVLTTVAELSESDLAGVIAQMGGKLLFLLSMIGVVLLIFPRKIKEWHRELFAALGGTIGLYAYIIYGSTMTIGTSQARTVPLWAGMLGIIALAWLGYWITTMLGKGKNQTAENLAWCTGAGFGVYVIALFVLGKLFGVPPTGKLAIISLILLPIAIIIGLDLFRQYKISVSAAFLVLLWFLAALYTSYSGVRFILLMAPAFGIAIAVTVGRIFEWMTENDLTMFRAILITSSTLALWSLVTLLGGFTIQTLIAAILFGAIAWFFRSEKEAAGQSRIALAILFGIMAWLFLLTPVQAGYNTASSFTPSISDGWWNTLTKINEETAPDAIINSWWDFGHWFKYVANRRSTADGTVQHTHVPRWLGLALVTPNERESVGVLRMLDCGSDAYPAIEGDFGAYGKVVAKVDDPLEAQEIVRRLVVLDKKDADAFLEERGFDEQERTSVLNATHCSPPEDYFITSGDMVGKAGVWAHFGLWDFEKAYVATHARGTEPRARAIADFVERFGWSETDAQSRYDEARALPNEGAVNAYISPWPGYYPPQNWRSCQPQGNDSVICPLGIVIGSNGAQQTAMDAFVYNASDPNASVVVIGAYLNGQRQNQFASQPGTLLVAHSAEEGMERIVYEGSANPTLGILFDAEQNRILLGETSLVESQFTQLFYLDGRFAEYYEKFSDMTTFTGSRIIVWRVNWDALEE